MALSRFPEGAKNCASEPSQPVEHDGFGFFSSGIFDSWQATDGWSSEKKSNIADHNYGYEK
jgi:hypothetical protein